MQKTENLQKKQKIRKMVISWKNQKIAKNRTNAINLILLKNRKNPNK